MNGYVQPYGAVPPSNALQQNSYQPYINSPLSQQQSSQIQQQQGGGLIWVQGEAGAKSYIVAPGCSVFLMDSEADVFYIKSADSSGMPQPLRIFDYSERNGQICSVQNQNDKNKFQNFDTSRFVEKDEFENLKAVIHEQNKKIDSIMASQGRKQQQKGIKKEVPVNG